MTDWYSEVTEEPKGTSRGGPPQPSADWYGEIAGAPEAPPAVAQPAQPETGFLESAWDVVTGKSQREPGIGELGTSGPSVPALSEEGLRMAAAYATSTDPQQIADIAVKTLPGATQKKDKHGNAVVTFEGKDYYVNRPGLSEADLFQLASQIVAYTPSAGIGMKGASLLSRAVLTGGTAAGTSMGLDKAAEALGSEQGVDVTKAAIVGAGGALFEGLAPTAMRAWNAIFRKNRFFNPRTGALTGRGRKAAQEAGLDVDDMTERLAKDFAEEAKQATSPRAALASAESKEFGIPYTRGQLTGNYKQIASEEAMRHGALGDDAGNVLRAHDRRVADSITGARHQVQGTLSDAPEALYAKEAQAGADVLSGVKSRASLAKQAIGDAYERVPGESLRLTMDGVNTLSRSAQASVADFGIDKTLHPAATRALKNMKALEKLRGQGVSRVALKRLETERRKLANLVDSAKNAGDRTAVLRIKRAWDDGIDDAVDTILFEGDPTALTMLKDARELRASYGAKFESRNPQDTAGKIVEKMVKYDATPEEAINYVIGRSGLGDKAGAVATLKRLKEIFKPDSQEWGALREAGWMRLSKGPGGEPLSPRKFNTAFNKVMEKNESLMRELYAPSEIALMRRYRDALMRTVTPDGAMNPSKTAYTVARLGRDLIGRLGMMATFSGNPGMGAGLFMAKRAPNIFGGLAAKRALLPPPVALPSPGNAVPPILAGLSLGAEELLGREGKP